MNNIIYIGSTDNNYKFHVGMTSNGRSPFLRWKDGDYRGKLPYSPQKVEFYNVGDLRDEPIHSFLVKDKNIIRVKDVEDISSDEIFAVSNDIQNPVSYITEKVEEAIRYHNKGIRSVKNFFKSRPHQEWVNSIILDRWNGETIIQPLDACARFGKTLCLLDLFKKSEMKVMVVASYWLSANESFRSTIENGKFDITSDIAICRPNFVEVMDAINKDQRAFIDVSLHSDAETIDEELLNYLSKHQSLVVVDEADFGAWTAKSKEVLNKYVDTGNNLVIMMTGTNMERALINSITTCSNIQLPICVNYLNLLEAKRGEGFLFDDKYQATGINETNFLTALREDKSEWSNRLNDIVEVSCLSLSVEPVLVNYLNELTEEKRANMTKIFSSRNSHMMGDVLRQLFDMSGEGTDVFSIYRNTIGSIVKPTVMMFIPGIKKDIDNLVDIGKTVLPEYEWVALHGDYHTNRSAEAFTNNLIDKTTKQGVIIISANMGARSYSVPNCCMVINCSDRGSIGQAVQKASRCFTPGANKKAGLVINYGFNTDRTSNFETDLIRSSINRKSNDDEETESAIRRTYGLVNFYRMDEYGYAMKLTEDDFMSLVTSPSNLDNMALSVMNFEEILADDYYVNLLSDVKLHKVSDEWKSVIDKAKSYINDKKTEGKSVNLDNKPIKDLIKKLETIVNTVGNLHILSPCSNKFIDCLTSIESNIDKSEYYKDLVGVEPSVVKDLVPVLPIDFLDLIIYNCKESKSVDRFKEIDDCGVLNSGYFIP